MRSSKFATAMRVPTRRLNAGTAFPSVRIAAAFAVRSNDSRE
jgi:hypothetical protein